MLRMLDWASPVSSGSLSRPAAPLCVMPHRHSAGRRFVQGNESRHPFRYNLRMYMYPY